MERFYKYPANFPIVATHLSWSIYRTRLSHLTQTILASCFPVNARHSAFLDFELASELNSLLPNPKDMDLISLPDLCLFAIFDRLPLADLLRLNLVCTRFASLYASACHRRTLLQLIPTYTSTHSPFESIHSLFRYSTFNSPMFNLVTLDDGTSLRDCTQTQPENHLLKCPELTEDIIQHIVSLFPNITNLQLFQRCAWQFDLRLSSLLLEHWSRSLVSLKLWFWSYEYEGIEEGFEDWSIRQYFDFFFIYLNSLSNLKFLDLNLEVPYYSSDSIPVHLPIISQLETLIFRSVGFERSGSCDINFPLDSLLQFGTTNKNLREIVLQNYPKLGRLLEFKPDFTVHFREVHLDDEIGSANLEQFTRFCYLFNSLTVLSFRIGALTIGQVAMALLSCPSLLHLSLVINFDPHSLEPVLTPSDLPVEQLPQLHSVKALSLFLTTQSHDDIETLHLDHLFPGVQVISLTHGSLRCTECEYNVNVELITVDEGLECMKLAWRSFKRCKQLKMLTANVTPVPDRNAVEHFTIEEL